MKFAKVRLACLGCKATLMQGEVTLCQHCKAKVISSGHNLHVKLFVGRKILKKHRSMPSEVLSDGRLHCSALRIPIVSLTGYAWRCLYYSDKQRRNAALFFVSFTARGPECA